MREKVKEIRSSQVNIADAFWSRMQEKVIDVVIPFQEKVLNDEIPGVEKSHAIENFRIAAGLKTGEFYGMVFQDSDVAKWLEGAAFSLAVRPDAALEARADEIIEIIGKAQQPDGYLDTYFIIKEPEHRWQNLHECHELYCAGHMMEAAVAYYDVTGKDQLLHVVERLADAIIDRFGPEEGKEHGFPGHQEVEIGLMKLYHTTGKEKYKDMARYFLEERGKDPDYFYQEKVKRGWQHWGQYSLDQLDVSYNQAQATIYDQKEAVGHAVRALYMYTAMADLARTDGDERLYQACRTLWENIVNRKLYITGGIGGNPEGEAFSNEYELPNDMAYAETCASIAMVFFAHRLLEMETDGAYADIMEKHRQRHAAGWKTVFLCQSAGVRAGCVGKALRIQTRAARETGMVRLRMLPSESGQDDHLAGEILLGRERLHDLLTSDDRADSEAGESGDHNRDALSVGGGGCVYG